MHLKSHLDLLYFVYVLFYLCLSAASGRMAAAVNVSLKQGTSGCGNAQMHWNTN